MAPSMYLLLSSGRVSTWERVSRPPAPSPSEHSASRMIVAPLLATDAAFLRAQIEL